MYKRRISGIIVALVTIVAIGAVAGGAWLYTKDTPGNVRVVGEELSLWTTANMTESLTSIDFADARVGTNTTYKVWASNSGDFDICLSLALSDNITQGLSLWANGSAVSTTYLEFGTLTPGQSLEVMLVMDVGGAVARGEYDFELVFKGQDAP